MNGGQAAGTCKAGGFLVLQSFVRFLAVLGAMLRLGRGNGRRPWDVVMPCSRELPSPGERAGGSQGSGGSGRAVAGALAS